ncbi:MAG: dTMP kinase [Acidobacteria bacterium]|nr:MAG: dTMP kinase [Acidobacteriota bacterium]
MSGAHAFFITIEGIEGAGKSTQAGLLARAMRRAGGSCLETREPGGGAGRVGPALRDLLRDPTVWRELGLAEIYLYAAARAHHVESVIRPALDRGCHVVCDRFLDSTRAYQGAGRGRDPGLIEALHRLPPLDLRPHRTILLDLDPRDGLARAAARPGRPRGYDEEDVAFFRRVREGFLRIAEREPSRVCVVDASPPAREVHEAVVGAVRDLFPGIAPLDRVE